MHPEHNPAHILHNDVRSDASSERRFLGRDIRRLVKIVHAAILNPVSAWRIPSDIALFMVLMQCMCLGMLRIIMQNVSNLGGGA